MIRFMPALTAVFCFGVTVSQFLKIRFDFIYFAGVIFLVFSLAYLKRKIVFGVFIILAVFALGGAVLKNCAFLPKTHISNFAYYQNGKIYNITGVIRSDPEQKGRNCRFLLETSSIEFDRFKYDSRGKILVNLSYPQELRYGDEIILTGTLRRPYKAAGELNYRDYLERQGIYCLMSAKLVRLKRHAYSLAGAAVFVRNKIDKVISDNLSPSVAGIMLAMVLGEKKQVAPLIYDTMVKTGTVHVLVVSGFNVGIVAFVSLLFLKILRVPRKARYILTILILIIYCLMTGSSNPVVRATIMGAFFLCGFLIEREPDINNALSLAALSILLANPRQLSDIGFQLSFASVIAIVWFYPKLNAFLKAEKLKNKAIRYMIQSCLVSLSAWLGTAGFIAYYFRIFSPVTVLANVFAVPLAALITLCGFTLVFTASLLPWFTPYVGAVSEAAITLLLQLDTLVAGVPGAYFYLPA